MALATSSPLLLVEVEDGDLHTGGGQRLGARAAKARSAAGDDCGSGVIDLHFACIPSGDEAA